MTTKTDEQELLPCPFCGAGTTEIRENGRPWLGTKWGEPVSVSVRHWCEPVDGQPSRMIERVGRDRAAAIAAWNRRAALQSQDHPNRQERVMDKLFCDLKTDEEKAAFFLSGRGYETGVISQAIQNDVAMAYHRCAEYQKELKALQSQDKEDAERYRWLRDSDGFHDLPYEDHGLGPEFPSGEALDAAIDHARRAEGGNHE